MKTRARKTEGSSSDRGTGDSNNGPETKRAKRSNGGPTTQAKLSSFFAARKKPPPQPSSPSSSSPSPSPSRTTSAGKQPAVARADALMAATATKPCTDPVLDGIKDGPIHPKEVPPRPDVHWKSYYDNHIITRKVSKQEPREKVAALDMDGTLLSWLVQYPSQLEQYELWSTSIIPKLRKLHDDEGYRLCIFSNQGSVRSAHTGKKATRVKLIVDWLAHIINRPLFAILSTKSRKASKDSYHKPSYGLWEAAEVLLNKKVNFDIGQSFFVGDSVIEDPQDTQGGVDENFALNVGKERNGTLKFYTPKQYFGPTDEERRSASSGGSGKDAIPKHALEARAALLGAYTKGPIMLMLCGIQGSGKSTFCNHLMRSPKDDGQPQQPQQPQQADNCHWQYLSQDTISNGKPGKREKVEEKAKQALEAGRSVIIDRTHLDPTQRSHFLRVAESVQSSSPIPVHIVVLDPPKSIIGKRVKERTNHPGKVQGEKAAAFAMRAKLIPPTYDEGFTLISRTMSVAGAIGIARLYAALFDRAVPKKIPDDWFQLRNESAASVAPLCLGMYKVNKKAVGGVIRKAASAGFRCIDTAPTYDNETQLGDVLHTSNAASVACIVKVPKRAKTPEQVRKEVESSLAKLQLQQADFLLLHWPSDVMGAKTMAEVWKAMEDCVEDGLCKSLGVCNFNEAALLELLPYCNIRPAINQVERHLLLPQWELLDFCWRNDIIPQAHSPLGCASPMLLDNATVRKIANEIGASPAQVLLRWNLQSHVPVVCKCSTSGHQEEAIASAASVELSQQHMEDLNMVSKDPASHKRFVAPPFMYGKATFCWGLKWKSS